MIRNGARLRLQHQLDQERRASERQTQFQEVQKHWRVYSFPVQEELKLHLTRFGLHAADRATHLLERMMHEIRSDMPAHDRSDLSSHSLTREQGVQRYGWSEFPPQIQRCLFSHVTTFTHQGDWGQMEKDIQSATALLLPLLSHPHYPISTLLSEHLAAFGMSSAADVAGIAASLTFLLYQTER